MDFISLRVTLRSSSKSPLLSFPPQARQIPNVRLVGSFLPSPRVHERTKMPPLTTSTLPSIRLSPLRHRQRHRQRTMFSAIRTSRRSSYSRSHLPPRTLLPPAIRGTRIRNNRRNIRRMHKVRVVLFEGQFIRTHTPSRRAEQRDRGYTAVVVFVGE